MKVSAIVPAAGRGRRFGAKESKLFFQVHGKPVLYYTLKNLSEAYPFVEILIPTTPQYFKRIEKICRELGLKSFYLIQGGAQRAQSVYNALQRVSESSSWVLIHDGARPLVSRPIVRATLKKAQEVGAALAAIPVTSTVKRVASGGRVLGTEDRNTLYLAQTPQVFKKDRLLARYKELGHKASILTDEASFFDRTDTKVGVAPGASSNLKITTPEDIKLFRFYLNYLKRG